MILEEMPSNLIMASGQEYQQLAEEAWQQAEAAAMAAAGTSGFVQAPDPKRRENRCPFVCRRCSKPLDLTKPDASALAGPWAKKRLAEVQQTLAETAVPSHEVPAYRGVDDDLRELRVAHRAEVDASEKDPAKLTSCAKKVCHCKDYVLRKTIPVDGDKVVYGSTYRFRVRVRDSLKWSFWTEFSAPVFITVPPPRPLMPQRDVHNPVPPPAVEVQLARGTGAALDSDSGSSSDVRLHLNWERFSGKIQEVEYRVFMWTLSPDQRRRASSRRNKGAAANFETKGGCTLPPITGTQTVVLNPDAMSCPEATELSSQQIRQDQSAMLVKPRAQAGATNGGGAVTVQHCDDGPQVIAHLRPFEAPPRANTMRRTPKTAVTSTAADAQPVPAAVDKVVETRPTVEVGVASLPMGYGYIFGVEAKHGKGVCGSVGEWSAPLFSKLVEFESTPRQLSVDIDAKFGALLFKAKAVTSAAPQDEQIILEAPAVNFVDEHRDLPRAMGLMPLPGSDPWPLSSAAQLGKYVVKTKGRSAYAERLDVDGDLSLDNLPEPRPRGDDFRDEATAKHAEALKRNIPSSDKGYPS
jgi:hypothetical protein